MSLDAALATTFKSITVSCTTFHFYYTISHLDEEVEYIWIKRWTAGKVAYLLTKYLGSVFLILASVGTAHIGWHRTDNLSPLGRLRFYLAATFLMFYLGNGVTLFFITTCLSGRLYTGLGTMIILLAEIILMMRVYAMFGGPRKMLLSFVALTLLLFGCNILQLAFNLETLDKGEIRPFANDTGVHNTGCISAPFMSGISWAAVSSVELLLFVLVLWKTMQVKGLKFPTWILRSTGGPPATQDIATLMARDSIVYFAVIFSLALLGSVLTFLSERSDSKGFLLYFFRDSNAYQTIVITIMTILAPKMLINIRAEYYGPVRIIATEISWEQISEHPRPQIANDIVKLTRK